MNALSGHTLFRLLGIHLWHQHFGWYFQQETQADSPEPSMVGYMDFLTASDTVVTLLKAPVHSDFQFSIGFAIVSFTGFNFEFKILKCTGSS